MTTKLTAKKTTKTGAKAPAKGAKAKKSFPALAQQIDTIRKLINKADRQDVENRYQIATRCLEVRQGDGGEKYGTNAVRKLAKQLGWSKTDVYDYANVALAWPDKTTFNALAVKTDQRFHKPLTWTHFRRLASEKDAAKRDQLIEGCLKDGWTVRTLTRHIAGTAESTAAPDGTNPESNPLKGLAKVIHSYDLQVTAFKRHTAKFGERLAAKINKGDPSDFDDAARSQLRAAHAGLSELVKQFNEIIAQFEKPQEPVPAVPVANEAVLQSPSNGLMLGKTLVNPASLLSPPNLAGAFTNEMVSTGPRMVG